MTNPPTIVLGLSYGHGDSSASLIVNGKLVAAAEEERFTRVKHFARFPFKAIEYCLNHACITAEQVHTVAIPVDPTHARWKKIGLALTHPVLLKAKIFNSSSEKKESLKDCLSQSGLSHSRIVKVEHHLAHMMSARILKPSGEGAILSFDGLGDFVSTAIGKVRGEQAEILERIYFPHSLGFFFTAMTHYLGFPYFGDEFKLMGLSSLGKPKYLNEMRKLIRTNEGFGFNLNLEAFPLLRRPMVFGIEKAQPIVNSFYNPNFITQLTGIKPRKFKDPLTVVHEDLAKSVQVRFEEVADHLLKYLYSITNTETLYLAGGCAHNSVWVGKIPSNTPFKKILVAPASHDAGISVGAAAFAANVEVTLESAHPALLGPEFKPAVTNESEFEVKEMNEKKLISWMVDELSNGKVVGLMQGRMEFGPRALGNRSILADPRNKEMKDRINQLVKHRESFRPFAASVMREHQDEWFKNSFHSPTMEAVFEVKENMRNKIQAVVHADQTCRIQSVTKETQSFFWQLLDGFRKKTGIPMLLNTSFNDSEPIVCTSEDAIRCFKNCEIDYLVIGNRVYSKMASTLKTKKAA